MDSDHHAPTMSSSSLTLPSRTRAGILTKTGGIRKRGGLIKACFVNYHTIHTIHTIYHTMGILSQRFDVKPDALDTC